MPGAVISLTRERAVGWACHPSREHYPVTLNVVLQSRVVRTLMVDAPPPGGARNASGPGWFELDLSWLALGKAMLGRLAFIVGETDEQLPTPLRHALEPTLRVEDILSLNLSRSWVTGATYHDALHAGRSDADILDLLYRDILGRPADPGGLTNYLDGLHAGTHTFNGIRGSLLGSDECRNRPRDVSEAPGAIFSLRLVGHAGMGPGDHVVNLLPQGTLARSPATAAMLEGFDPAAPPGIVRVPYPEDGTVTVLARAREFESGWHGLEGAGETERRWMERTGTILNPWPHLPVANVVLRLHETHLNQMPELRCFLGETEAPWRHEGEPGSPSRIWIGPPEGETSLSFVTLRLESLNAGSPLEQGVNADPRMLSVAVYSVVFTYAPAVADPPADGGPRD